MSPPSPRNWIVALVLALIALSQWSALTKGLWIDEYSTLGLARSTEFWARALTTNTPPTYTWFVKGLLQLGVGEFGLRVFSLGLFIAALGFTFATLRKSCGDRWALVGVFWLGTRPTLLYHATEIRAYALLYFAVALNLWLVTRLDPRRSLWLYASFSFLVLTHAVGILYLPLLLLLRWVTVPHCARTPRLALALLSLSGVVLLTFYKPFLQMDWWGEHYLKEGILPPLYRLFGGNYSATGLGILGGLAAVPLLAHPSKRLWLAVGVFPLALFILSHFITAIYLQRTLAPLLFFVALTACIGAQRLPHQTWILGGFVLLGVDGLLGWDKVNHLPRFNYKQAAHYLNLTSGPEDFLVLKRGDFLKGFGRFYHTPSWGHRIALPRDWGEDFERTQERLRKLKSHGSQFRVILPLAEYLPPPAAKILGDLKKDTHYDQLWVGHVQILEFSPLLQKKPPRNKHVAVHRLEDSFEKL